MNRQQLGVAPRSLGSLLIAVPLLLPILVSCGKADDTRQVQSKTFEVAEIESHTRNYLQLGGKNARAKDSVSSHLLAQARSARLVDDSAIRVTEIPDPFHADQTLTIVSEGDQKPTHIDYAEAKRSDDDIMTAGGFQTAEASDSEAPGAVKFGGGYLGATNHANMTTNYAGKYNEGCSTFTFGRVHKMTSCYQKFRKNGSNTREYIYNRWMLFTVGDAGSFPNIHYLKDLTIRSRQWQGDNRIERMTGWLPASGTDNCTNNGNLELGIGVAKISAPIRKCSSHKVIVDTNQSKGFLMGLDWSGTSLDKQHRLDAAGAYIARTGSSIPRFADYNWATTQWCSSYVTCDPSDNWVQKDSQW